jgi:hypothetical protein
MIPYDLYQDFIKNITHNNLCGAKYILHNSYDTDKPIDIHANYENAFVLSCQKGHLEIAKWLWQFSKNINSPIDIHANYETAFIMSCCNGYLEVAKWLWEISNNTLIDINYSCNYAFRLSCENGHLKIAKWLWEIMGDSIDIHSCDDYAFMTSCKNAQLCLGNPKHNYADYLENKDSLNKDSLNKSVHLEIAKWLCTLDNNFILEIENNKIIKYKIISIYDKMINIDEIKYLFPISKNHTNEICLICKCDDDKIMLNLQCIVGTNIYDHCYCMNCFVNWYRNNQKNCLYCFSKINLNNAILLLNKDSKINI